MPSCGSFVAGGAWRRSAGTRGSFSIECNFDEYWRGLADSRRSQANPNPRILTAIVTCARELVSVRRAAPRVLMSRVSAQEEHLTAQLVNLLRGNLAASGAESTPAGSLQCEIDSLKEEVDALSDEANMWMTEFGEFCGEVGEIANIEEWARRVEQDMLSLGAELEHSAALLKQAEAQAT